MTVYIQKAGVDLATLLAARGSLTAIANTGIQSGGVDLATIFANAINGVAYGATTGILKAGVDIGTLFARTGSLFVPVTTAYTTSQTITAPAKAAFAIVELFGGSGGGGKATNLDGAGSGGVGARVLDAEIAVVGGTSTIVLTIGAAGAYGLGGTGNGGAGGATTATSANISGFGTLSAGGGGGGFATANGGGGGTAGVASGGATNTPGKVGISGIGKPNGGPAVTGVIGTYGTGSSSGRGGMTAGYAGDPGGVGKCWIHWR